MMMNPIDTMSLYDKINSRIYILRSANNAANTQMKTEQVSQMENGLHWLFSIFFTKGLICPLWIITGKVPGQLHQLRY